MTKITLKNKSSIEQIEERFDNDVERFSNLESGQVATIDAPLTMELITRAALATTHPITKVLDIGCGAGNNTIKLLELSGIFDSVLVDLSENMLVRAKVRVLEAGARSVRTIKQDFRTLDVEPGSVDIILAAAVLHHLRDDQDWRRGFEKLYTLLRVGGSIWVTDLVSHDSPAIQEMMWARYGDYLVSVGGEAYRDKVFNYIEIEDSPRSLQYQLKLLKVVGFSQVEVLHKNGCFAAFGGIK
ncbi:MAG: class I SAM-dependent methyltransferase [Desulfobulbaceae bacterium]|nr:MAG: class I SAM-dependent methyltransferase [Desulfobulbaceae bacterium]